MNGIVTMNAFEAGKTLDAMSGYATNTLHVSVSSFEPAHDISVQ